MNYLNNASIIKRQVMVRLAKMILDGDISKEIDLIPVKMAPKHSDSVRCCIYHDRAVLRGRVKALLGFSAENITEEDEVRPLSASVEDAAAQGSSRFDERVLTVIDEACSACVRAKYRVTNACRGCVARPCTMNCPKKAIKFNNGHAEIDESLCVSCGMCSKVCPYHAIIYQPIPCEEACPVGAISKDEFGKEKIDVSKCIYCGKCLQACPFGAIMERSEIFDILRSIKNPDTKTVAMVAPSIAGQFNTDFGKMVSALKKLGFDKVIEVAYGADITAAKEAAEFTERINEGAKCMTSSCCPAYIQAVKKHMPGIKGIVSTTLSPMQYTGEYAAKEFPGYLRVFIGPCIAKRHEARDYDNVDNVMTYEELGSIFVAASINVAQCEDMPSDRNATATGMGFAVSGGVSKAVKAGAAAAGLEVDEKPINGLNKKSIMLMKVIDKTIKKPTFIEVMTCEGGCLSGPGVVSNPLVAKKFLDKMMQPPADKPENK